MNTNPNPNDSNAPAQNDAQFAATKYPPPPPSISGRSTASFNPNIPPPMPQPAFMPPPPHMDWWNPYHFGPTTQYDEMSNQGKKPSNSKHINQMNQTSQMNQMNQYMDPAYMYYMMAAAAAAYPTPFGYPPYGAYPYPPMPQMNQSRFYPDDDQRSVKSFLDLDNRSEKLIDQNKARSIAGDQVKLKQSPPGLLMPEHTINEELELNREINNLNLNQNDFIKQEEVMVREQEKINRMTPLLHQLPHVRCSFSIDGLIRVRPNDPCDGQPALVDVFNLSDFMESYLSNVKKSGTGSEQQENELEYRHDLDDFNYMNDDVRDEILTNYKLVQEFPGPLSKELNTSKAQVIQFCLKNVKECLSSNTNLIDPQSHALLWDFLALLVRQNGLVDLKTDISPLLLSGLVETGSDTGLKNSESSQTLNQAQDFVMIKQKEEELNVKEEEVNLNRLRQLLGAGQKSEAIDYTIKHNMWSHSLFLASSTFNYLSQTQSMAESKPSLTGPMSESKMLTKVKLRFISSLPQNDPIITCYQLLMGRVPAAASSLSKSEWNDWRRHLAMIVSNIDETNQHLVLNTIKTMGDSLASNGRIAASHFCYLLSNCSFGTYDKKSSKLVLIGSSHNQEFSKFCQIGAIQATEIFEYAQSLLNSTQFNSDNFLKYKLIYANKLLEHGLMHEAYKYIEIIAKTINNNPSRHTDKLSSVYHLANRLKIYDPDYFNLEDSSQIQEPLFLTQLSQNYFSFYSKNISHLVNPIQLAETKIEPKIEQISFAEPQIEQTTNYEAQNSMPFQPSQLQQIEQQPDNIENANYDQNIMYEDYQNYQKPQNEYYQHPVVDTLPSRRSSISSVYQQQQLNYLPNDQLNQQQLNYLSNDQFNQQQQQQQQLNYLSNELFSQQQQMNYLPNDQTINQQQQQQQQYYQPTYNQTATSTTRSRASSTSTTNDSNLLSNNPPPPPPPIYDPTHSVPKSQTFPNYYQPMFTPEVPQQIVEEPRAENKNQMRHDEEIEDDLSVANPKPKSENNNEDIANNEVIKKSDDTKKGSLWDWFKKPAGPKKMILPDDKKKTIIWDDKLKKYVNKDDTSSTSTESVKPPPISAPTQSMPNINAAADSTNKFSLRNTNTKRPSNYYAKLDIMADKSKKLPSNGSVPETQTFTPMVSNLPPPSQLPPRFFVPEVNTTSNQQTEPNQPHQRQHQQQQQQQQALYFNPAGADSQQPASNSNI